MSTLPIKARAFRMPAFVLPGSEWDQRWGPHLATCDHCGAGIKRVIIDTEGRAWGVNCFARATGNPIERSARPAPAPFVVSWRYRVSVKVRIPTGGILPTGADEYELVVYDHPRDIPDAVIAASRDATRYRIEKIRRLWAKCEERDATGA